MAHEPILIIDDNPSNVKLERLLLSNAGFEVRTAGDSDQALEVLRSFTPRLILMDIQLPGMDGLKLTRLLKTDPATCNTIIVAVTAYAMRGDEEQAKAAGCEGYITKPIDTRAFVSQVRQYLDRAVPLPSVPKAEEGDPSDLLRELRNGFVSEGEETSRRYAHLDLSGEDLEGMKRLVHHWAGMGGTLGFPEITKRAREMEQTLETLPLDWTQLACQGFACMHELFMRSLESGPELALSADLTNNLASKQVGLIGFGDAEIKRIRAAFDQVHATARDLGALSRGLGMDSLCAHDLIILNTCSEDGVQSFESIAAQPLLEKPLLLVSSRAALLDSNIAALDRAVDFVLAPWDSEELLCRARRMIGRRPEPPAEHLERDSKPLVLIADDDPMIHSLLTPMLAKMGVSTKSVQDGQQALDAIRQQPPDVLVLDIGMPRLNGLSVLRELRKTLRNQTVQVLMLSVRQQQNDISMAFAYGANDYAVKPFDPEDVVLRIMRLLRHLVASLANES